MPCTTTALEVDALRRSLRSSLYSGELYQRLNCCTSANSTMTRRCDCQSPSIVSQVPPLTRNLPPYRSSVASTPLRYSAYVCGSVISWISTMKYAAINVPFVSDAIPVQHSWERCSNVPRLHLTISVHLNLSSYCDPICQDSLSLKIK